MIAIALDYIGFAIAMIAGIVAAVSFALLWVFLPLVALEAIAREHRDHRRFLHEHRQFMDKSKEGYEVKQNDHRP